MLVDQQGRVGHIRPQPRPVPTPGIRASELCRLALLGPDGLPDLMLDSLGSRRGELWVRWDGGAKGHQEDPGGPRPGRS
jgi:hypothetical protein